MRGGVTASQADDTDSVVGENADEFEAAEPGDAAVGQPTVENRAADEAPTPAAT